MEIQYACITTALIFHLTTMCEFNGYTFIDILYVCAKVAKANQFQWMLYVYAIFTATKYENGPSESPI